MKKIERLLPIFIWIFILSLWKIAIILKPSFCVILPPPEKILEALLLEIKNGDFGKHILSSVLRVGIGVSLASLIGIFLGFCLGWFKTLYRIFESIISFLRVIPPLALLPLAILWLGIGELSKVFIIFYGAFFPIVLNTIHGVMQIDKNLIKLGKSMNFSAWEMFKEVILPGALPSILTGIRIGFGMGWMCVIAAEIISGTQGLGYMIEEARLLLLTPKIILGIITIGFIGLIGDKILQIMIKKLTPWV